MSSLRSLAFPSNRPHTSQLINYLLTPWITIDPLTFEEGSSWYKGEIPPIAIDEEGQSLGYRVRYGRGTLTLFGDGDALSDQLRQLAENRRFAQAIIGGSVILINLIERRKVL